MEDDGMKKLIIEKWGFSSHPMGGRSRLDGNPTN
jgi:hypothetical protein